MVVWVTTHHDLLRQHHHKTNPMSLRPLPNQSVIFAEENSVVLESETDISNHTFRIRFVAHPPVVPGRAVAHVT